MSNLVGSDNYTESIYNIIDHYCAVELFGLLGTYSSILNVNERVQGTVLISADTSYLIISQNAKVPWCVLGSNSTLK